MAVIDYIPLSGDVTPFRHLNYLDAGWRELRGARVDPLDPSIVSNHWLYQGLYVAQGDLMNIALSWEEKGELLMLEEDFEDNLR